MKTEYQIINNQYVPTMRPTIDMVRVIEPLTDEEIFYHMEYIGSITANFGNDSISKETWRESLHRDYSIDNPLAWQATNDMLVVYNDEAPHTHTMIKLFVNYPIAYIMVIITLLYSLYNI